MAKKYGFTTGILRISGWIEPDGTFFPCEPWKHEIAAVYIASDVYDDDYGDSNTLLNNGWVRCAPPYMMHNHTITEQQLATAREVASIMQNEFVKEKFIKNIEKEERWLHNI